MSKRAAVNEMRHFAAQQEREEGIMLLQRCLSLLHPSSLDWHPYLTIMAPLLPGLRLTSVNYVVVGAI